MATQPLIFPHRYSSTAAAVCRRCGLAADHELHNADQRIFAGNYPAGIVYADRWFDQDGDYKTLAFLSYDTLELDIRHDCPRELADAIIQSAALIQAKRGQKYQVSTCGQTVTLGIGAN